MAKNNNGEISIIREDDSIHYSMKCGPLLPLHQMVSAVLKDVCIQTVDREGWDEGIKVPIIDTVDGGKQSVLVVNCSASDLFEMIGIISSQIRNLHKEGLLPGIGRELGISDYLETSDKFGPEVE